ncbi:Phytochrome-like protein [Marinobacterium lacunae]|uniref:Phytochrome-like protein n=1 Tax=Marinobacterium lacunae TaxID=1232683 RepID=A0A081G4M4_9GAMM|nr:hypothetical protein [Marinobacterium lacunae]KEA65729.1 Phytochrome-like protein [Marinobacterium lacunae]
MEPSFHEEGWRGLDVLLLAAAIVILVVAGFSAVQQASLWLPGLAGLAFVLLILAYLNLRQRRARLLGRLRDLERSLIGERMTDSETGVALPQWFARVLDTECRRAVRDFTPITLMQLDIKAGDPALKAMMRVKLAAMLTEEISRPGDLVGIGELGDLQLLLPSTNENAQALAMRCIENAASQVESDAIEVRLAACTLQPKADLNTRKICDQLDRLLQEVRNEPSGSYRYHAEPAGVGAFNSAVTS